MTPETPSESNKKNLRNTLRSRLREAPDATLSSWSQQLVVQLQARTDFWCSPGIVALFGGLRSEPDLISELMPWLHSKGWKTALFTISDTQLRPVIVQSQSDLKRGYLGVWEPLAQESVPLEQVDLILVPGLAFSPKTGARLGRGGGFYDRLLARPEMRARLLGVAFQMQLLPEIPMEKHDAIVPEIVTERGYQRVVPIGGINA
jgi:5-formyltetrahydrofolate cyclo-ligase